MKTIELSRGMRAIVDDDDFELLGKHVWCVNDGGSGIFYAKTSVKMPDGSVKYPTMHQVIMGCAPKGMQIDHINRRSLDNRRSNLRFVSRRDQMINRNKFKNKSSNYVGVSFRKDTGRWQAYYCPGNGKMKHVGFFGTEYSAYLGRKDFLKTLNLEGSRS